jgi:DNA-binding transcriptional ArsR family regulator
MTFAENLMSCLPGEPLGASARQLLPPMSSSFHQHPKILLKHIDTGTNLSYIKPVGYLTDWFIKMQDQLSNTFAALADPTRRAILARLALGETSVTELASPFEMSMPGVSKHLKVLERAGLIVRGREAQWRPCRLHASPLKEAANWIEEYRRFWSAHVDALERHLDRMGQTNEKPTRTKRTTKRGRRASNHKRNKGETK